MVLGWRFKGNGKVSMGNLRETESSISPLGNNGNEFVSLKFRQGGYHKYSCLSSYFISKKYYT